jgi:hypothetical protein
MRPTALPLLAVIALALLTVPAAAAPPAGLGKAARAAYHRLVRTDVFEDEKVGYGGELSDNVADFRVLFADPKAGDAFAALAGEAGPAGRLYALAGLWHTDRAAFTRLARAMARSKARVAVRFGCLGFEQPIAALIDGGAAAIQVEDGQTVHAAVVARGGSGAMDMLGGSYPQAFAGNSGP